MTLIMVPINLYYAWNRNLQKIRITEITEPELTKVTIFIEKMVLVNGTLFTRKAATHYSEKITKSIRP